MRPVVLLSDFGLKDHYVGVLHGVLVSHAPGIERIDLCHDVSPGDVWAGSFLLRCAWRHLPPRAVVLAVVDPGVGGPRRPMAVAIGDRQIVGPDNGLVAAVGPPTEAVELDWRTMGLEQPSKTFHGRDLFAPAAAHLALERAATDLGREAPPESVHPCPIPEPRRDEGSWRATVIHVDRFGNLITNLKARDVGGAVAARYGRGREARLVGAYVEAEDDEVVLLEGSSEWFELAVRCESAEERTGLRRGDSIEIVET